MTLKQQEQILIEAFGKEMQEKLDKRSNKGRLGWRKKSMEELFQLLLEEKRELGRALFKNKVLLNKKHSKEVRDEAIDVANFAMMIWDKAHT